MRCMSSWGNILAAATLLFAAGPTARAEVEFVAEPEARQIEEGENLALDFVVTADSLSATISEPRLSAPDFDEVNVFQRGTSVQSVYENGRFAVRRSERITVVLHPKKTGRLTIGKIAINVNGKTYTHPDVTVEVVASGQIKNRTYGQNLFPQGQQRRPAPMPRSGLSAPDAPKGAAIFLRTEPDKSKVYKGEQINLTYALYSRAQIASIQVERFPTASGFLKEDLDIPVLRGMQNLGWTRTVVNGVEYRRAELAEYALFPVREGNLPLDVFSAKLAFRSGGGGLGRLMGDDDDAFGLNRFFQAFQLMTETRESDRRTVEVLPLPAEGQPPGFSGLVGDFEVSVAVDKYTLKAGEPLNVKVKIQGKGHAGGLERLNVQWPADFELYEDRSSTKFQRSGQSERQFDILLIPRAKGTYQIPPIEVAMFDPAAKAYKVRKTEPITIDVLAGEGMVSQAPRAANGAAAPGKAVEAARDIRYLLSGVPAKKGDAPLASQAMRGLSAAALAFMIMMLIGYAVRPPGAVAGVDGAKILRSHLRQAESLQDSDPQGALAAVDAALSKLLETRAGVARGSLTQEELGAALRHRKVAPGVASGIMALVALCENQRFLPPALANDPASAKKAVGELKRIVDAWS